MAMTARNNRTPLEHRWPARRRAAAWCAVLLASACAAFSGRALAQDPGTPATETAATAPAPTTRPATARSGRQASLVRDLPEGGILTLMANKGTVVKTRVPYKSVSISQPDIADVSLVGPTDLLLTGKKPGATQLILWDDDDRTQVIEVVVSFDLQAVQQHMRTMFPDSRIEVTSLNGTIALRGRVPSLQTAEQAEEVAAPYGQKVLNFLEVAGGQQVVLQIRFAEISRSASTNLAFNFTGIDQTSQFSSLIGPGADPIGNVAQAKEAKINPAVNFFGRGKMNATSFEYFIQALRRNNLLRVLAEPNLVVYSGSKGSFLAGGEFPIPVPKSGGAGGGGTAITVEYKQFGVRLDFTPVVLGDGRIRLKVTPEVSDLDFSRSVSFNGFVIPSLTKRTLTTEVELAEGQSFAVAGLLNNRVTASKDATPLLGDLPIIGALFRSVRYDRNETELVVLVTPRLVEAMNPDQVPALPGERWRYPSEGELLWKGDLGGPREDVDNSPPQATAGRPARFRGQYGFVPAE
jgi:pilus assembly protein CpaC